mmetsp:Transcript_30819/g.77360  ORF Transcript_30819/g.77360 Transcript_30819/m.77360 type:complete len:281 (+) Transcript_30819:154-996(+)|eukprot:CAMPEP_0177663766 /NCGR_PEP_ID=MMETSP0447-20121125/20103_1 /TAXON_ID=0 /ORGANISM="Stygamoeba regulata, Strain BSH-02190019" /LENGTH=280 /DNA_ID=CAMNT_0019169629 /DNA_START=127 /DNA_END=969 /DNA_ORIENTATION=-
MGNGESTVEAAKLAEFKDAFKTGDFPEDPDFNWSDSPPPSQRKKKDDPDAPARPSNKEVAIEHVKESASDIARAAGLKFVRARTKYTRDKNRKLGDKMREKYANRGQPGDSDSDSQTMPERPIASSSSALSRSRKAEPETQIMVKCALCARHIRMDLADRHLCIAEPEAAPTLDATRSTAAKVATKEKKPEKSTNKESKKKAKNDDADLASSGEASSTESKRALKKKKDKKISLKKETTKKTTKKGAAKGSLASSSGAAPATSTVSASWGAKKSSVLATE